MKFSRRTYSVFFLILATFLCLRGGTPNPIYDPPPPDIPFPDDPPVPFDNPFDPVNGLPDPFDLPFPPEDPPDLPPIPDPFDDVPPPDISDPFDEPSLFPDPFDDVPDPFDDLPPLPDLPPPGESVAGKALPRAASGGATNIPTPLMPFPMRLPFHPAYMGVSAPRT